MTCRRTTLASVTGVSAPASVAEIAAERVASASLRSVSVIGVAGDALLELCRSALGDNRAIVDDEDPITERIRLIHVVGGQKHRGPQLIAQLADVGPEVGAALRIEPGRGFVEEHQLGLVDQAHHDIEPPPLTTR